MLRKTLLGLVAVSSVMACNISDAVKDLQDSVIDSAFESIKKTAEENGGAAMLVKGGAAATLEVTKLDSPLKGAKIIIPAGAIPADVEHAALSIQGGGAGLVSLTDDIIPIAPTGFIALVKLPGGEVIELTAKAEVTVPYASFATAPEAQIVLSLGDALNNLQPVALEGSSAKGNLATGMSQKLGAFGGAWKVDYDGSAAPADSFMYKVVGADEAVICVGYRSLAKGIGFGENNVYSSIDGTNFQLGLAFTGLSGSFSTIVTNLGIQTAVPNATGIDVAATSPNTAVNCGQTPYAAATIMDGTYNISTFVETSNDGGANNCTGDASPCTNYTGSMKVVGTIHYTTAAGEHVWAGFNGTNPAFAFSTKP